MHLRDILLAKKGPALVRINLRSEDSIVHLTAWRKEIYDGLNGLRRIVSPRKLAVSSLTCNKHSIATFTGAAPFRFDT